MNNNFNGYENGIVSSAHEHATRAGLNILKNGGNAVDAAVATSFTLGVVVPPFSGIGGGGFVLIYLHDENKNIILDFREPAPSKATDSLYKLDNDGKVVNDENNIGYKAVGIPSHLSGISLVLEKYGTMNLKEVTKYAIDVARNGFQVSQFLHDIIDGDIDDAVFKFRKFPEAGKVMLKNDGSTYKLNDTLKFPELANTMENIAENGIDEFYTGKFADLIANDMNANGGLVSKDDLKNYKPIFREPLTGTYKNSEFVTMPPPSSGGVTLIQTLKLLEDVDLKSMGSNTVKSINLLSNILRVIWDDRDKIGDPKFNNIPVNDLISDSYISSLKDKINNNNKLPDNIPIRKNSHTTHFSVMDKKKNVVALTESVNDFFGSGTVTPGTGIFMNNTMHDFDPSPNTVNSVEPNKIPMSSMTPTIFFKDSEPQLILGSAAGPRIITAIIQVSLNVLEHKMSVQDAVSNPRFHFPSAIPDPTGANRLTYGKLKNKRIISLENRISKDIMTGLENIGYGLDVHSDYDFYFGGVHALATDKNKMFGGADPRRDGVVLGY